MFTVPIICISYVCILLCIVLLKQEELEFWLPWTDWILTCPENKFTSRCKVDCMFTTLFRWRRPLVGTSVIWLDKKVTVWPLQLRTVPSPERGSGKKEVWQMRRGGTKSEVRCEVGGALGPRAFSLGPLGEALEGHTVKRKLATFGLSHYLVLRNGSRISPGESFPYLQPVTLKLIPVLVIGYML